MQKRTIELQTSFESCDVAKLVHKASEFASRVSIVSEEKTANAKSIMGIISLNLQSPRQITIIAAGDDELAAVQQMEQFFLTYSRDA